MSEVYQYTKLVTEHRSNGLVFGILYMKSPNKPSLIEDDSSMGMASLFTPNVNKYEDNGYSEIEDAEWFETEIDRWIYLKGGNNE